MKEARRSRAPVRRPQPLVLLMGLLAGLIFFLPSLPTEYQDLRAGLSLRLADRNGTPLRNLLSERQGTDHWITLEHIPPVLVQAVLVSEDRRFYVHPGVDPLAIARALKDNLMAGGVTSGASTVTQQLLRSLAPTQVRTPWRKLGEAYWAIRLEFTTSKDELLEAYLNRAAFGPSVYGVEEAARYYFDKPSSSLSLAEAAMLAVLLRAPASFDPFSSEGRTEVKRWSDDLIRRMQNDSLVSRDSAQRALAEEWDLSDAPPPFLAPHFCDLVLPQLQGLRGEQRTSLDLGKQVAVEGMLANHLHLLQGHKVGNAAVLVADVRTGEVLVLAGSADFHRQKDGQHNAATSLRQPGSTLKPFTYALLLETVGHPGFILPDLPIFTSSHEIGFIPENYDGRFHGPVSIRSALGSSYNVPAVRALERVGVDSLLTRLRAMGMHNLDQPPAHYGLGLTLGDGSTSLWQLVEAYRTLARQGAHGALSLLPQVAAPAGQKVFDPRVAAMITDVLSDRGARIASFGTPNVLEFPFPVAVKTGTSKGYRDNWCLGYTPQYVVGVWVGNSDGTPMLDVSGIAGAGPLFRDVVLMLGDGGDFDSADLVSRQICSLSGMAAGPHCPHTTFERGLAEIRDQPCTACKLTTLDTRDGRTAGAGTPQEFRQESLRFSLDPIYREWAEENGLPLVEVAQRRQDGFRLVYPMNGDIFLPDHDLASAHQKVKFRAVGGQAPYRWSVNGRPMAGAQGLDLWWTLQPGRHEVRIQDASGLEDSLSVNVIGGKK